MMIDSPIFSICYELDLGAVAGGLRRFDEPQQQAQKRKDEKDLAKRCQDFCCFWAEARSCSAIVTARSISPAGAGLPVQISNCRAACCTNISTPGMTAIPLAPPTSLSSVSPRPYTMPQTTRDRTS